MYNDDLDLDEIFGKQDGTSRRERIIKFLSDNSPADIEQRLNKWVIGQEDLTRKVGDFLYYHALRQLHPYLPQRPILIDGPSGTGKTEVWRAARKEFEGLFPVRIVDGTKISCEGWTGNYKTTTFIDDEVARGGILVVDEFDKLARPRHTAQGDNVANQVQAEFLKLMEGEATKKEGRSGTVIKTNKMGFAFSGAFIGMRDEQDEFAAGPIGFGAPEQNPAPEPENGDEMYIRYGVLPEIVGRIAIKCSTQELSDEACVQILEGPHSRVHKILTVLKLYGVNVKQIITREQLQELIDQSRSQKTGIRWVSAQVENRIMERLRTRHLQWNPDDSRNAKTA